MPTLGKSYTQILCGLYFYLEVLLMVLVILLVWVVWIMLTAHIIGEIWKRLSHKAPRVRDWPALCFAASLPPLFSFFFLFLEYLTIWFSLRVSEIECLVAATTLTLVLPSLVLKRIYR
jgi:hypothetical protein